MLTSGILQGLVLGPQLFVIFINDIPNPEVPDVYEFADNAKILNIISKMILQRYI